MNEVLSVLVQALFLVTVVERVVAAGITPLFDKKGWDKFALVYVAWVLGAILVFLARINLFTPIIPGFDPLTGQILSAVVAGGGANLLHDLFDNKKAAVQK